MKRFALAGNPNSGKTTLFNVLTGSTAHVGNWPGVTVDKREGIYKKLSEQIAVVDLPGIYSLSPYTPEEVISRNYILDEKPDCIINIVDATNLERNLYLTTQILEMDVPVVIALNMIDEVDKAGDKIDEKVIANSLGVPVVKVSALKGQGLDELMSVAYAESNKQRIGDTVLKETEIMHLIGDVKIALKGQNITSPLFHAIKLIENDELEVGMHKGTSEMVDEFKATFKNELFGTDLEALIADARYKYITANCSIAVTRKKSKEDMTKSDKIDKVLTHRIFGIPIFVAIIFALFHLTFSEDFLFLSKIFALPTLEDLGLLTTDGEYANFGVALLSCVYDGAVKSPGYILFYLMDLLTSTLSGWAVTGLESISAPAWVLGLLGDGVLGGICGVLSFVPQIVFLLFLLSILEDSGYMSRVAFILDRMFRRFGISGRAVIPMIMGFGCSVPAMVNTRTLIDERERLLTIRTIPFFSCGAKLPILVAVAGAVAHMCGLGDGSMISFAMYIIGMVVAVVTILIMRGTTQRGKISPFIMELPAYRLPSFKSLMVHMWDKAKHYIQKVFTVILASTIVIWFLSNFGWNWKMVDSIENSILASLGQFVQPIFTPLGFGSQLNSFGWVFAVAAVTGLIAKEDVIATFGTLGALFVGFNFVIPELSAEGASDVLLMVAGTGITWQGLIAFIVFNMTTIPCFAAVAAAKGEHKKGTFKWTVIFWIATSMIVSSLVYVVLSWWWTSFIVVAVAVALVFILRAYNKKRDAKVGA